MYSSGWTFMRKDRRLSMSSTKMPPLRRMTWTGRAATLSDRSLTHRKTVATQRAVLPE